MSKDLIHKPRADSRGTIAERLERLEKQDAMIRDNIANWIAQGIIAASKKLYNEVYDALAEEHGRVFEVQEQSFKRLAENLHARLCVLEASAGVPSPSLADFRGLVDAIAEEVGSPVDDAPVDPAAIADKWIELTDAVMAESDPPSGRALLLRAEQADHWRENQGQKVVPTDETSTGWLIVEDQALAPDTILAPMPEGTNGRYQGTVEYETDLDRAKGIQ